MIDTILSIFHPSVKREWEAFYPNNVNAIAKFLFHSDTFPSYKNPIDRCSHRHDFLRSLPKKYHDVKIKDLLEIAPYRLMQFVLANQSFVKEAFLREQHYNEVINLLDSCKHGVTSVCNKHFSFTLLGGTRLPKGESFLDGLDVNMRLHHLMGIGAFSDHISFSAGKSKRGERTLQDVTSIKNARTVDYEDLDVLFQELYPYLSEIQSEEKRVVDLLHKEDIEEQFKKDILGNERRKLYFKDFLKSENHDKDSTIDKKDYCLLHIRYLDAFISRKLKKEVDTIADHWPLGYEWYEQTNSDSDIGDMLGGDDFLYYCIKNKTIIIKKQETLSRYQELLTKYPDGIQAYIEAHKTFDDNLHRTIVPDHEDIISLDENRLKEYQKNAKQRAFHEQWLKSQMDYALFCHDIKNNTDLASWGAYRYIIPFKTISYNGEEIVKDYPVWQLFPQSYCLNENLDYSNNKTQLEKAKNLIGFKNKIRYFKTTVYDKLLSYIKSIHSKYGDELVVLFGTSGVSDYEAFNDFHFAYLKQQLNSQNIPFKEIGKDTYSVTAKARYIIVEVVSDNTQMKQTCKRVLDVKNTCHSTCAKPLSQECFSDIVYISLNKELSSEEMRKIINDTQKKIAKQKELEEKKKEEESKRQETEQNRKNEQIQIKSKLLSAVSSWDTLFSGLHYSYMFYYYPTTCEFEATEEEWYYRRLVWDFKNTPGKTSPIAHQIVLGKAITMIKNKLLTTFEETILKYLTFVCIPASSQVKTQARYEEFSNRICSELGLINGYPHVTVVSEKEEKHLGGTGIDTSKLSFDEAFFNGKYVLLFDDIITKGISMWAFKRKMEDLGATVVGGLSLGKTKHERPVQGSIPQPFYLEFPPKPIKEDLDDLPF